MGGNLVLAKEKALESDVATLLSALQAQVGVTSVDKEVPVPACMLLSITHACLIA